MKTKRQRKETILTKINFNMIEYFKKLLQPNKLQSLYTLILFILYFLFLSCFLKSISGTSLVVQWLRIRLPMQGMRVQSLVRELRSHHAAGQLSSRATTREPMCRNYRAHMLWSPCHKTREKSSRRNERSQVPQLRHDAAKNK